MNNIFYKQRAQAENRAVDHMKKTQQLQGMDPLPELPLDHILYGNPALIKQPCSTYKAQF